MTQDEFKKSRKDAMLKLVNDAKSAIERIDKNNGLLTLLEIIKIQSYMVDQLKAIKNASFKPKHDNSYIVTVNVKESKK